MSDYLSIRSASAALDDLAETTIRAAVASGELPVSRWGRAIRISRVDLLAWAKSKASA